MLLPALLLTLTVAPPSLSTTEGELAVGERETTTLVVTGAAPGDVQLAVEAGELGAVERTESGELRATWRIPDDLTPRRLAAAAIDRRTGEAAFVTVAISRRAVFHVRTGARAAVRLTMRGVEVASGVADDGGRLDLSVLVPPGVDVAGLEENLSRSRGRVARELGLRDQLRLFGIAARDHVPADGTTLVPLYLFSYRDGGAAPEGLSVSLRAGDVPLQLTASGSSQWRAEIRHELVPPPRPLPASVLIEAQATVNRERATWTLELPVAPPPLARLMIEAPPRVVAGQVAEVLVRAVDVTGRPVPAASVTWATEAYRVRAHEELGAGTHRFRFEAPSLRPGDGRIAGSLRGEPGAVSATFGVEVDAGPPARIELSAATTEAGAVLVAETFDAHGNPVDASVAWSATGGAVEPLSQRHATWRPASRVASMQAQVTARVTASELATSTGVAYEAPQRRISLGIDLGYETDVGRLGGPGTRLQLGYAPASFPDTVSLALRLGMSRSSDRAEVAVGGEAGSLERQAWLTPALVGAEYAVPLGGLRVRAGVGAGALVAVTRAELRQGERLVNAPAWRGGAGAMLEAWAGIGVPVALGELRAGVSGWQALSLPAGFAGRPHAAAMTVGYAWVDE